MTLSDPRAREDRNLVLPSLSFCHHAHSMQNTEPKGLANPKLGISIGIRDDLCPELLDTSEKPRPF
jgi:hypothetical protein